MKWRSEATFKEPLKNFDQIAQAQKRIEEILRCELKPHFLERETKREPNLEMSDAQKYELWTD